MFVIEAHPFAHPYAARLIDELQDEYLTRYGTPDETPIETGEFDPPAGRFLIGLLDGDPVAAGGWRRLTPGVGEIKRMYVAERARRRGLARLMMAELEATLADAGYDRVVLMTGVAQPEAIALYESSGYAPIDAYGMYAGEPNARFYGKPLTVGVSRG
ncbi:MAG TPA: GNAT family N-acetyltransferase [Jatrophihabitantaceae bacterium]